MPYRIRKSNNPIPKPTTSLNRFNENILKSIHFAIHDDCCNVKINYKDYPILINNKGCRYVDYEGVKFMEQNVDTSSLWAKQAKTNGRKITWGIRPGVWMLIVDDGIILQY